MRLNITSKIVVMAIPEMNKTFRIARVDTIITCQCYYHVPMLPITCHCYVDINVNVFNYVFDIYMYCIDVHNALNFLILSHFR